MAEICCFSYGVIQRWTVYETLQKFQLDFKFYTDKFALYYLHHL